MDINSEICHLNQKVIVLNHTQQELFEGMILFNIPELRGNKVPIQLKLDPSKESANIVLLEETINTVLFLSQKRILKISIFQLSKNIRKNLILIVNLSKKIFFLELYTQVVMLVNHFLMWK